MHIPPSDFRKIFDSKVRAGDMLGICLHPGVGTSINQAVHLVFVPSISAIQHLSRWSLPRWVSPQEENVPQPLPGFLLLLENKRKFVSNPMQLC